MNSNNTSVETTEVTDTTETQSQAERTYTQREVDDMMAKMKASVQKRALKPYEDLGDPEQLRQLVEKQNRFEQEQQLKRGEFDKIIQDLAAKKDAEIQKRDSLIREYKVDTPLLQAAAQYRSVNPEQVKSLLKGHVRLNSEGEVEVTDSNGTVRYNDAGSPLQVTDLVREFLDSNPHFVQPTPSTASTRSSINTQTSRIDVNNLDMKNPAHRKIYKEALGR